MKYHAKKGGDTGVNWRILLAMDVSDQCRNLTVFISLLLWGTAGADWNRYLGPNGSGISDSSEDAVLSWDRNRHIKWRTDLPGPGNSSPIVSNGRVFITCSEDREGKRRSLYSFDRDSGKARWKQTVDFGRVMPTHKTNPHGSSTPVTDGKRVVAWHGSAGLYCYDFDGKELWSKQLGEFRHMWGYASSPIIYKDRVILHCGPGQRVFLTAIDLETGKTIWETDEPVNGNGERNPEGQYTGSWTTPVIVRADGRDQIMCSMTTRVNGYDPETGEIIWTCDGLKGRKGELAYSSPMIAGEICVQIGGFGGPSIGFTYGGQGNITKSRRLWRREKNPQSIGNGVHHGGYLYVPDAAQGTIRCIDPKTGNDRWRARGKGPNFWSSIVKSGNRLYATNQQGDTVVFAPNPEKFEQLAINSLGEPSNSTLAISRGEVFARTFRALYCIAD